MKDIVIAVNHGIPHNKTRAIWTYGNRVFATYEQAEKYARGEQHRGRQFR